MEQRSLSRSHVNPRIGDNIRNTEIYAKLLGETKRKAVDRMAALFDIEQGGASDAANTDQND